jgi:hypothetical protein
MSGILFRLKRVEKKIPLRTAYRCKYSIYKLSPQEYIHSCGYYKTEYYLGRRYNRYCSRTAKYMLVICIQNKKSNWYIAYLCPIHIRFFKLSEWRVRL